MLLLERMAWISAQLQTVDLVYNNEYDLQAEIHATLTTAGATVDREVTFANSGNRIDMFVQVNGYDPYEPGIGLEVKTEGSTNDVRRQLQRYADEGFIGGLILVTTRTRHRMPTELNGKPVLTVLLLGASL